MSLEAFKSRVLPVKNKLYRFALKLTKNSSEAEDVVQDVMLKMWDTRSKLPEIRNVEAWCMRMVRNLAYDRLKSKRILKTESISATLNVQEQDKAPDDKTELRDAMTRIQAFIEQLPEKQRQAIHLRDIEGYSYKEIGDIMEIDVNQVKINLFRARQAVREKFISINTYGL